MPSEGIDSAFRSGELLLPGSPSGEAVSAGAGTPVGVMVLVAVFVVLLILQMRNLPYLLPLLFDSIFRARGSVALESSVRASNDRNTLALTLLIPLVLLTYRYRLYDPSFLRPFSPEIRLLAIAGVIGAYLLLRLVLYKLLKPRRKYDFYQLSHRASFTFFILAMLLILIGVGLLALFGVSDGTIRLVVLAGMGLVYLLFLLRRAQILALSCNPLRTFLYLCGLEILPTAALVVSAVIL